MHVEGSLQINSALHPWATDVQLPEERSKGRNGSERTIWVLTIALPSVGLLDIRCGLTERGLCTVSGCEQGDSPVGSEKRLVQATLPEHLLDYFLWKPLHAGAESPSTKTFWSLCFKKHLIWLGCCLSWPPQKYISHAQLQLLSPTYIFLVFFLPFLNFFTHQSIGECLCILICRLWLLTAQEFSPVSFS